jgi:hypothetical protein
MLYSLFKASKATGKPKIFYTQFSILGKPKSIFPAFHRRKNGRFCSASILDHPEVSPETLHKRGTCCIPTSCTLEKVSENQLRQKSASYQSRSTSRWFYRLRKIFGPLDHRLNDSAEEYVEQQWCKYTPLLQPTRAFA